MALLDAGADAARQNAQGQTPWDLAMGNYRPKTSDAYCRLWRVTTRTLGSADDPGQFCTPGGEL